MANHPDCLPYYQPTLDELTSDSDHEARIHSFEVYHSKEVAQRDWPDSVICEFWGDDIENHVFLDEFLGHSLSTYLGI